MFVQMTVNSHLAIHRWNETGAKGNDRNLCKIPISPTTRVQGLGESPIRRCPTVQTNEIFSLSFHWRDERKEDNEDETKYDTGTDLSADFHTYGVDWESNSAGRVHSRFSLGVTQR